MVERRRKSDAYIYMIYDVYMPEPKGKRKNKQTNKTFPLKYPESYRSMLLCYLAQKNCYPFTAGE